MRLHWVFRLYDAEGVCLYVGRTHRDPVLIARSYRSSRPWGSAIVVAATESDHRATLAAAKRTEGRWIREFAPAHRTAPVKAKPQLPAPPRSQPSILEGAARAQQRHRELRLREYGQ